MIYPAGMQARVFRGIGFARGAARLTALAVAYGGAFAVLHCLGLVVRGWQGWTLVCAPLVAMIGARLWAWRRVSVELIEGVLRYEAAVPSRDFEVPIDRLRATYFDRTLRGAPLVLALDGDERVCAELSPRAARALRAQLTDLGVRALGRETDA